MQVFDKDGSGTLSTEELREIMTKKGKMRLSDDENDHDNDHDEDDDDDHVIIQIDDHDIMTRVMMMTMIM